MLTPKERATLDGMTDRSAQGYADALGANPSTHDETELAREYSALSHLKRTRSITPTTEAQ